MVQRWHRLLNAEALAERRVGRLAGGKNRSSRFVQRARRPIGKPYWSPTHGAPGTKVHEAFPPFPPTKKKRKESILGLSEKMISKIVHVHLKTLESSLVLALDCSKDASGKQVR